MRRSSPAVNTSGLTLVEVLVVGLVSIVILGVMFQLLVPSMSLFKTQMAFSQAHQSALMAGQKIKREISNTGLPTLTIDEALGAFSFAPKNESAPFDSNGRARYANRFIVYFLDSENKLNRKFWPHGADSIPPGIFDGPNPPKMDGAMLLLAATSRNGSERVLASRVSHFRVTDSHGDPSLASYQPVIAGQPLEPPLRVEITCSVPTQSDKVEEYEVELEVSPRSVEW